MNSIIAIPLGVLFMFTPLAAVFIVEKLIYSSEIRQSLLISFEINKWWLAAFAIPVALLLFTFVFNLAFPGVEYSREMDGLFGRLEALISSEELEKARHDLENLPVHPALLMLMQGIIAGATINTVAAFGEELGWRGFMVNQFRNMHFMKAALIIGFIWGIWHAPLILMGHNYAEHPQLGVGLMTIWCILLSPLFLYITVKTKSVVAAAVMHGVLNGTANVATLLIKGGNDITNGATGMAGFIAAALVVLCLFVYDVLISREKVMLRKTGANLI